MPCRGNENFHRGSRNEYGAHPPGGCRYTCTYVLFHTRTAARFLVRSHVGSRIAGCHVSRTTRLRISRARARCVPSAAHFRKQIRPNGRRILGGDRLIAARAISKGNREATAAIECSGQGRLGAALERSKMRASALDSPRLGRWIFTSRNTSYLESQSGQ